MFVKNYIAHTKKVKVGLPHEELGPTYYLICTEWKVLWDERKIKQGFTRKRKEGVFSLKMEGISKSCNLTEWTT